MSSGSGAAAGAPLRLRPAIEHRRLGTPHIGLEAAEPEQARRPPFALPHGEAPGRIIGSNAQEFQAKIAHLGESGPMGAS